MPTAPTLADVLGYLEDAGLPAANTFAVASALASEVAAQAKVVRFPADPEPPAEPLPYPADLAEALFRRVAHNLAVRPLALGVQVELSETAVASTRVGGVDAEVRRLEAPYRKRVVA